MLVKQFLINNLPYTMFASPMKQRNGTLDFNFVCEDMFGNQVWEHTEYNIDKNNIPHLCDELGNLLKGAL